MASTITLADKRRLAHLRRLNRIIKAKRLSLSIAMTLGNDEMIVNANIAIANLAFEFENVKTALALSHPFDHELTALIASKIAKVENE